MLDTPWIAALCALFAWWFSTGAILVVVRLSDKSGLRARRVATWGGLPLLGFGLYGYASSLPFLTTGTVYVAFLSALAIWGWIEMSFLTGIITGPNLTDCPENTPEWERFLRAWGTVAYHEMLLTLAVVCLILVSAGSPNQFGMWTFVVLYFARISAKLNLYLGVPRINTEFIPGALSHLPSHFRIKRSNWLFPISVTALTFAVACWLERFFAVPAPAAATGFALLTAITALALLEHWLMVLPLPDAKLWRWMLPAQKTMSKEER